jgi:hypothetical protein
MKSSETKKRFDRCWMDGIMSARGLATATQRYLR